MDLVRINASRLSTLCLCFHPGDFDEWARRRPHLDQLRELAIEVERRDETSFIHLGDTFADSKYLHRVVLDSVLPSQIYLPWTQITEFECRNYSPAKAVELLNVLPNLLRFTIILSDPDTEDPRLPELHHSTHSRLEYLRCSEGPDTGHTDVHMLAFLTLPNLTTLIPGRIDDEVLHQFLDRSGWPPLTKLDFYDDCWESYTEILMRLQHLKELHIDYPSRIIMGRITSGLEQDDPSFLPNLERFSLFERGVDAIGGFLSSVGPAVRARNLRASSDERFSRVRSVKITTLHGDPEWTRFRVPEKYLGVYRQLRDEGVEVHVGSPEYCFVNGVESNH
uniref:Uncharacterized protein n=1 Tax=Mycena chlorophos TaxID=658473 RepID=A0ABQ0M1C0_MYCCL|nr:predicted protein [Mycena chlorophos]